MKIKRIFTLLLAAVMLFSLAACSGGNSETESNSMADSSQDMSEESSVPDTDIPDEAPETEPSENSEPEAEASENPDPEPEGSKILVAYFSATGNTEGIAQQLAEGLEADLYEIVPETPYTSDDLNYSDSSSRSSVEMNDPDARPGISGSVENMEQYDMVLIGYPNWWASIPMPIASFLEEYDFEGKTIVPFCSHGGGRFGQSLTTIAKLAPNATMGEGLSIHYSGGSALSADVEAWLELNNIQ